VTELVLLWILSLPQAWREEKPLSERTEQVRPIAESIARWTDGDIPLAAIAVSVGWHETKFLERIQAGRCFAWECDRGFARGYFQPHKDASLLARERWDDLVGLGEHNIDAQVEVVIQKLRRGRSVCRTLGGAASYYARGDCRWAGANKRAKTAELLLLRRDPL
jgi:hypothetical protein